VPKSAGKPEVLPQLLSRVYDDSFSETAFIAGGKVYRLARERLGTIVDVLVKETPFGCSTPILFMEHGERRFYVVPRHGEREYRVSAPFVNYRANVWALKELGTRRIVAWSGPGALSTDFRIGEFLLPTDLLDLTRQRPFTFFEQKGIGLLRQRPPFCSTLEGALDQVLTEMALGPTRRAVYAVSEGPRLETAAEVRMLQRLGADVVGMTLAPEGFLARELEMCYHPVAYVTAYAEGVGEDPGRDARDRMVAEALEVMPEIIWNLLELLPHHPYACSCQDAMLRYKQRGLIGDDFRDWIR
jgi:5'-methylthioadenosine phosphorylase